MNLVEFLRHLRQTPRHWIILFDLFRNNPYIRNEPYKDCPIVAVHYQVRGDSVNNALAMLAAQDLGLPLDLARRIMDSSDGIGDNQMANALRRACGLENTTM